MPNCKLQPAGKQLVCPVCTKPMPMLPNWQKLKRHCPGPPAPPGTLQNSWALSANGLPLAPLSVVTQKIATGPGTELKKLLAKLNVAPSPKCDCNAKAAQMDEWGVDGCRKHRDIIIEWMRDGQAKWGWKDRLIAAASAVVTGIAFKLNPLDPFPGLIDEAINRAQAAETWAKGLREIEARQTEVSFNAKPSATASVFPAERTDPAGDRVKRTGFTRNLIMFLYPKRGPEWKRNLDQILKRIDLFNGKKIFAIATDSTTVPTAEVLQALSGIRCEVLEFKNRADLGEVVAFRSLLEKVQSTDPNAITFYCHAKGVTHQEKPDLPEVQRWTDAMIETCLDGIDQVEAEFATGKTFVGTFRAIGLQFQNLGLPFKGHHFSGTFYWFKNDRIFSKPEAAWGTIAERYHGAEAWPGTQCNASDAAFLLLDRIPFARLYVKEYWDGTVQPALDKWRQRSANPEPAEAANEDETRRNKAQLCKGTNPGLVAPTTWLLKPWEGMASPKPWEYKVTACIPLVNPDDSLRLVVELLRLQTVRPYIILIDTGSSAERLSFVDSFRDEDLEVHQIRQHGTLHPSEPVSMAMDLAAAVCRTRFLFHTHSDCFLRRRDVIEELIPLAETHHVAGHQLSKRAHADWREHVGHTMLMLDQDFLNTLGITWSMRRGMLARGITDYRPSAKRPSDPDTETTFNRLLKQHGIKPYFTGTEANRKRNVNDWFDHVRSWASSAYMDPGYHRKASTWAQQAIAEAEERVRLWTFQQSGSATSR